MKVENLHRSARKTAHLLAQEGHRVSRQSVWRWLGEANLNQPLQEGYTRFEHREPNDLWQGDWMGEEQTGAGPVQLLLFLDDYSRFILRGRFCHRSGRGPVFSALREDGRHPAEATTAGALMELVHIYNPVPAEIEAALRRVLLGVYEGFWTELARTIRS